MRAKHLNFGWFYISIVHNPPLHQIMGTFQKEKRPIGGFVNRCDGSFFSTLRVGAWFFNLDILR